ncbi:MAG: O-acetyl-ADP-ribose deacetylase (regulator of RNase III) [Verrucomicrobiales bacterium]|jgi:O-acetyl-ADP-ribose deacetylase (regulator of RNase III)
MRPILGNITQLEVDAIVNAANSSLLGGGGVDGAIHRAAGSELVEECRLLGGCTTGEAKITGAYHLPATFIIHTVGPVWTGGGSGEAEQLKSCYEKSLQLATDRPEIKSIAFPCVSTGIFNYPANEAAAIAVEAARKFENQLEITFCCFSARDLDTYLELLGMTR